jgi:hypothetical protein
MNDDEQLRAQLDSLSTGGTHRGADAVWSAAVDEVTAGTGPTATPRLLAVAAAVLVVVAGGWWALDRVAADRGIVEAVDGAPATDDPTIDPTSEVTTTVAVPPTTIPVAGTTPGTVNAADGGDSSTAQEPEDGLGGPDDESTDRAEGTGRDTVQVPLGPYGSISDVAQTPLADGGWQVEVIPGPEPGATGGALRRLEEPVAFRGGELALEVDYAAVVGDRGTTAWGEIVITAAAAPTPNPASGAFYAADQFTGQAALGCRLQGDQEVVCQLIDGTGERVWQLSWFEIAGRAQPTDPEAARWRTCEASDAPEDPDAPDDCLVNFTLVLGETEIVVLVDGLVHLHQTDLPPLPASLTEGPVHVYLASAVSRHGQPVARFDWGPVTLR